MIQLHTLPKRFEDLMKTMNEGNSTVQGISQKQSINVDELNTLVNSKQSGFVESTAKE